MAANRTIVWIFILIALFIGLAYYLLYGRFRSQYNWQEGWPHKSYSEKDKEPYGAHIAYRLVSRLFPDKESKIIQKKLSDELPLDSSKSMNYVFIGEGMFMDSADTKRLLDFVSEGHTALISSKTVPYDLMFSLYYDECNDAAWNDYVRDVRGTVKLSLPQPSGQHLTAQMQFASQNVVQNYQWHSIPARYFCPELPQQPIGYLNDTLVNFALFPHGKGRFLLHTTPLAFSNYSLLRPEIRPYVEGVLSWLSEGDMYWDAYSRVPELLARNRNRARGGGSSDLDENHAFSYILKQPTLAWSWYILLAITLLWFIFRSKRRQRAIPVLPKNENTSYEFIRIISNLHFREKNYGGISYQRMRQFLAYVRDRYGLAAHLDVSTGVIKADGQYFQRLSTISGASLATVKDIFDRFQAVVQYQPNEQMMVDLHLAIERFFKETAK